VHNIVISYRDGSNMHRVLNCYFSMVHYIALSSFVEIVVACIECGVVNVVLSKLMCQYFVTDFFKYLKSNCSF
jgi:hypothetical protein